VGYKRARIDDLVINIMLAWNGSLGVTRHDGLVSPAYCVYHISHGLAPWFLHNLLRSPAYRTRIKQVSRGVVESRLRLYTEDLGRIEALLPPPVEQTAIVRLLDHQDRLIRTYIRAKQKLIALLTEQKQAIIQRAVTRGLNPNVKLKPSGVDWLGEIPEGWEVRRLKDVGLVQSGLTLGKRYGNQALIARPYLRVANVQAGYLNLKEIKTVAVPPTEAAACQLERDDVLMTEGGDIDKLGRGYIWNGEIPGCLHQNHIFAVRVHRELALPAYVSLLMVSRVGRNYFQSNAKQTTNLASTNKSKIRAFPFPLPTLLDQERIIAHTQSYLSPIDVALARATRQIAMMLEYRTRLIADVVTGKVDVRQAAEALPDDFCAAAPNDGSEVAEMSDDAAQEADK
jgi:type I restriction enzyme S subunit